MLPIEFVTENVYKYFENVNITRSGTQFLARCSLCGDSKKSKSKRRFNLTYDGKSCAWHCWNCGKHGNFYDLYAYFEGIDPKEAYDILFSKFSKFKVETIKRKLSPLKPVVNLLNRDYVGNDFTPLLDDCIDEKSIVDGYQQKKLQDALIKFRKDRCIDDEIKLYIAVSGDYRGRIIIPVFEGNRLVYFQGRSIDDYSSEKYKNPPCEKSKIILNKDKFDRSKYIIVCEGILDANTLLNQGTTCLGKELSNEFIETVLSLTDVGVILALDNDDEGVKTVQTFIKDRLASRRKGNSKIKVLVYPNGSLKDLNAIYSNNKDINMYDFVVDNSVSVEMAIAKLLLKRRCKVCESNTT